MTRAVEVGEEMLATMKVVLARTRAWLDALAWSAARQAVDAVRYRPRHVDLVLACGTRQPEMPAPVARWLADTRARPTLIRLSSPPPLPLRTPGPRPAP